MDRGTAPAGTTLELDLGTANPKQRLFYESRTLYTAYGGARGTMARTGSMWLPRSSG